MFPSTQQYDTSIYFNITYIVILATCFDSYESSSGINIQELLVHTVLVFFTKPGLSSGFVMHKGIPIAIVRLRQKNCKT